MEIIKSTAEEEANNNAPLSYKFDQIQFDGFSPTMKENLLKWGLEHSLKLKVFRFNVGFSDLNSSAFLQDLLNSDTFQVNMPDIAIKAKKCTKVGFKKLKISMLNMNFLDTLEAEGLIRKTGTLSPCFGEVIKSVEIVNLIRDAWLNEDGEHYCVFDEELRKELLIQVFNLLVIGGVLNQYDDKIEPYRESLKELYKEMITVKKDAVSGSVFCDSLAYTVQQINDDDVFELDHPQNKLIVIVSPSKRQCVVFRNKWSQKHKIKVLEGRFWLLNQTIQNLF